MIYNDIRINLIIYRRLQCLINPKSMFSEGERVKNLPVGQKNPPEEVPADRVRHLVDLRAVG
jgi:hypothetical protein